MFSSCSSFLIVYTFKEHDGDNLLFEKKRQELNMYIYPFLISIIVKCMKPRFTVLLAFWKIDVKDILWNLHLK